MERNTCLRRFSPLSSAERSRRVLAGWGPCCHGMGDEEDVGIRPCFGLNIQALKHQKAHGKSFQHSHHDVTGNFPGHLGPETQQMCLGWRWGGFRTRLGHVVTPVPVRPGPLWTVPTEMGRCQTSEMIFQAGSRVPTSASEGNLR